ncbi:protein prune homolog 2-like isoform X2 [Patiria miniata]|uniref:CRAL-TRIO domain-containing protein n=1 Tax=Patiria miniata TaxID=46514 RepID=A0A914A3M8_PATMI|nr:protein prune homolog 2-like isoform X2 [Patiria miniata]
MCESWHDCVKYITERDCAAIMDTFLRETKDRLESARADAPLNIHVVLGNESCDLDSAVSALVWAYHLQKEVPGTKWDAVVPVLNIPFEDYHLRTEVKHFLSLVNNIGASLLVFRDDVDLHSQHASGKLGLTLVDHNTLPKRDASLDGAVQEVIDHHSNSRQDDDERDIRVTVETVGSCASLVAEKVLAQNPEIVDEHIAKLLLGPILVDTVNLSASAGKATPKDIAMVEALSKICPDLNKEEMYQELQQAKADMSDFSVTDILRKDFKCVSGASMNIGMSSIPIRLTEFVEKPDFEIGLQDFCTLKDLRLLVLMALTVAEDAKAHRQICVYSSNSSDSMKDELIQTLEESASPELVLSELYTNSSGLIVYYQGNVKASRKQVLPLVKNFLDSQEDSSPDEDQQVEEDVATESDLTDMNDTLLKLSNNTNNANEQVLMDNPLWIGDSQAISSPDSSGIDAGSVLLDLDPFSGNQDGMVTSGSGAFSSGDSVDTIGITPSSPSSDAMGFGSGSEDLLGLDNLASTQKPGMGEFDSANSASNPFADSTEGDFVGLDAFMSQPAAPSDPNQNPFGESAEANTTNDLFSFDTNVGLPAPVLETTVSVSANPFIDEDPNRNNLLDLDPFASSVSEAPVASGDSLIEASVSTTVESSATDLGDFMNQLPGSPDAADQKWLDPSSDVQLEVAVDNAEVLPVDASNNNPFAIPSQTDNDPFGIEAFGSPTSDFTDEASNDVAAASTNPFKSSEPPTETSSNAATESSTIDFGAVADYHPGSPGFGVVAEPSDLLDTDSYSDSPVVVGENLAPAIPPVVEGSSNLLDLDGIETDQAEVQAQELLHPTPEITISRTSSDYDQETSETENILEKPEDNILDDLPSDENQDVGDEEVAVEVQDQPDEGFNEMDNMDLDKADQEVEEQISPGSDLDVTDDDKSPEDSVGDNQRAASGGSEDEASAQQNKQDEADVELDEMSGNIQADLSPDESISITLKRDQEEVDTQLSQSLDAMESPIGLESADYSIVDRTTKEEQQNLDDSEQEELQDQPPVTTSNDNEIADIPEVDSDLVETSLEAVVESTAHDIEISQTHDYQCEEGEAKEEHVSVNEEDVSSAQDEVLANSTPVDIQAVCESEESCATLAEDAAIEPVLSDTPALGTSASHLDSAQDEEISSEAVNQLESVQGSDELPAPASPTGQEALEPDDQEENVVDNATDDFQEMEDDGVEDHAGHSEDVSAVEDVSEEPSDVEADDASADTKEVQESEENATLTAGAVIEMVLPDATDLEEPQVQPDEIMKDDETVSSQEIDQVESVPDSIDELLAPESPEELDTQEPDQLDENIVDDGGDHVSVSDDVPLESHLQPNKESEVDKAEETILPATTGVLESAPDVVDEVSGPDSTSALDVLPLELSVGGATASAEQNFSPMSDEGPARSSGVTSPDSEFTSDIISDDPSSGDSYIVTDLSHEAGNFQIADIQEEIEEEDENQAVDSKEEKEEVEDLAKCINGIPEVTLSEDFSGDVQVGVIDDYYAEEMQTDSKETDVIPIPTDVGFAESGRSSPQNVLERADSAALQEEASDLVEGVLMMAKFAFLEEKRLKNCSHSEEAHTAASGDQLNSATEDEDVMQTSETVKHEPALPSSEVSVNGEVTEESITDQPTRLEEEEAPREVLQEEFSSKPPQLVVEEEIAQVVISQEESALPSSEVSVNGEVTEESITDQPTRLEEEEAPREVLQEEFSSKPPQLVVEEEIAQVVISQEESVMTVAEEQPSQEVLPSVEEGEDLSSDQDALHKAGELSEEKLIATTELPVEQEVPRELAQESKDFAEQLDKKETPILTISADMTPNEEMDEAPKSPIEVNVVISKQGLQDVSSNAEEVANQTTAGKTKLVVEDSMKDVDIEIEDDNRQTSMFGLADILEYVNADGEVEGSTTEPHVRPSTLALTAKSTPKSARLMSAGTPISMLSDTGTPLTPISMRSLDMLDDTGTDEDTLDRTEEEGADTENKGLPPAAKRSVSVDTEMVEDIHGEWDDNKKLMDVIVEKERKKSLSENVERKSPQRTMSVRTAEAKKNMEGVELPDEWQDDEFSQQKLAGVDSLQEEDSFFKRRVPPKDNKSRKRDSTLSDDGSVEGMSAWAERLAGDDGFDEDDDIDETPSPANGRDQRSWSSNSPRKVVPIPVGLSLSLDGEASVPSTPAVLTPSSAEMSWDDDTMPSPGVEPIPEYTAKEELEDRRNWRKVVIANKEFTLDMRAINPYKKVLSHGGYYGDGVNAIIVIASCYMPDRSRKDYNYIMNNLFLYVISTLELLVANDYVIVYFHGAAPKNRIPSLNWMRKCYQMIDRKLRKNLKGLYIVHPTMWLRTIVRFTRPFISSKFSRKLKFVEALDELPALVNMEYIYVPDEVRRFDEGRTQKEGGGGVAVWGWISSNRGKDGSSEDGGSSCSYTMGPDSDIVTTTHDEDYLDDMLYVPTSRAARRRMSAQLRRGNFALWALKREQGGDSDVEDWDSHGFMEDDMFADIEDDGMDSEDGEVGVAQRQDEDVAEASDENEAQDLKHRRSVGDEDLEYEEEIDPFAALHAPTSHHSHHLSHSHHQQLRHHQQHLDQHHPDPNSESKTTDARKLHKKGIRRHLKKSGKK